MAINNVPVTTSKINSWVRDAANRINQAITYVNQINSRTEVTGAYTIADSDHYLAVQGGYTVTLSGALAGRRVIVKDEAGTAGVSTITVVGTIDGAVNKTITTNYGSLHLVSDGTNWFIV